MPSLIPGVHDRWTHTAGVPDLTFLGTVRAQASIVAGGAIIAGLALLSSAIVLPVYGPIVAIDASLGNFQRLTATNGVGFTISDPTNLRTGQILILEIRNTSGGALGAIVLGASYRTAGALPAIATANNRKFAFEWDGVTLTEIDRSPADVPN
jgi:hypothetical protein